MSKGRFIFRTVLFVLILGLIASVDAFAEDVESRKIVVTSVSLEIDGQGNTALFEGNVVAKVDHLTMYSDRMKVTYSESENKVAEIYAKGNVRVHNEGKAIFSKEAKYIREEEKIIFIGTPKVIEGENIITGTKIIYFFNDDRAIVEGSRVVLKNIKTEK